MRLHAHRVSKAGSVISKISITCFQIEQHLIHKAVDHWKATQCRVHNRRTYNRTLLKSKKSFCDNDNCLHSFSVALCINKCCSIWKHVKIIPYLITYFYSTHLNTSVECFEKSFCEMTWLLTQNKARNIIHILSSDKGYVN